MMHAAVIVQARMTSTRLPGKVLKELCGMTVLAQVLRRCMAIPSADSVCVAVPVGSTHDDVAWEAERCGVHVERGSESDVLARYLKTAHAIGASTIMRVTSDCPMIDPALCDRVLSLVIDNKAEYACNNMPPSWPHGLDCEAFSLELLERASQEATTAYDREHVTPWMRRTSGITRVNIPDHDSKGVEHRWTLDFPEDLEFFRALLTLLPPAPIIPSTTHALQILSRHPEISNINRRLRGHSRPTETVSQ